ncbi:MAG: Mut7-C RNAse domain-containing protein [Candidatus Bathyarchaeota archaeon]|nr:MAG: Mut7-C RNAse domain-containing protein [Candidatus Bathyarchaeota archaeon]
MLGKLTRWLRMLGQNVEYSESLDDKELIKIAEEQHRTLLTRDLTLYQKATTLGLSAFLVDGSTETEKLANVAKRFNLSLEVDVTISRCPKCNTQIKPISKAEAVNKIPEKTSMHYKEFWMCPQCEKVYWHGAHWKQIEKTLKSAKQVVGKLDRF